MNLSDNNTKNRTCHPNYMTAHEVEEEEKFKPTNKHSSSFYSNKILKHKSCRQIIQIQCILLNIFKYLSFNEIIRNRRININFNNELYFKFKCNNFNIYFEYNNTFIKKIIENQICNNIQSLPMWYFHLKNRYFQSFFFSLNAKTTCTHKRIQLQLQHKHKLLANECIYFQ